MQNYVGILLIEGTIRDYGETLLISPSMGHENPVVNFSSGLIISALVSGSNHPGLSPGQGHYVLSATLFPVHIFQRSEALLGQHMCPA